MKTKSPYFYLFLFLFLNVLNFIDRNILFAFGNEIKADFNLTNTQWGLVSGIVFLLFYATCSIFIGALGDRLSRTKIIRFPFSREHYRDDRTIRKTRNQK